MTNHPHKEVPVGGLDTTNELPYDELVAFPAFGDLPSEIRLQIWQLAFPPKQEFKIPWEEEFFSLRSELDFFTIPNPTTLLVNHESREETQRHYKILFRADSFCRYFNPTIDFLNLEYGNPFWLSKDMWRIMPSGNRGLSIVRFVKMEKVHWYQFGTDQSQKPTFMKWFTHLEKLDLIGCSCNTITDSTRARTFFLQIEQAFLEAKKLNPKVKIPKVSVEGYLQEPSTPTTSPCAVGRCSCQGRCKYGNELELDDAETDWDLEGLFEFHMEVEAN
ncbi:hypothetical protein B0J14DRAFT_632085 [Halenospora varia]|nr:hypothetical protein B0J14DRAFT_632085 [Halenospora varia]